MMVTTAAKGLLIGNLATIVVLFSAESLSVIVPPYLQWITEREKRRYQESYLVTTSGKTAEFSVQERMVEADDVALYVKIAGNPEWGNVLTSSFAVFRPCSNRLRHPAERQRDRKETSPTR